MYVCTIMSMYCMCDTVGPIDLYMYIRGMSGRIAHLTFRRTNTKYKRKRTKLTPWEATLFVLSLKLFSPKKVCN